MKTTSMVIITVSLISFTGGCREKDHDRAEIEHDLLEIADRLKTPQPYSFEFGQALAVKISKLSEPQHRERLRDRFEQIVFSSHFNADDYNDRFRHIGAFCDIADGVVHATVQPEKRWLLRLKIIEKLHQDLMKVKSERTPDNLSLECYVIKLGTSLNHVVERFERRFNERDEELTEAQRNAIRKEFARIMGRPLRTSEEITRDRQRLIEEAQRRQETIRGGDVRVDIESL